MSYSEAIALAGATINDSEWFGSYQGDALFDLTVNGRRGILVVGYGSCGGCDHWESFAGYGDPEHCEAHAYTYHKEDGNADCADCKSALAEWVEKVIAFGQDYLQGVMYGDEVAKYRERLVEQTEWDHDAAAQLVWLDAHTTT